MSKNKNLGRDRCLVDRIVNIIIKKGKRGISEKITKLALSPLIRKTSIEYSEIENKLINNVIVNFKIKKKKIGGGFYQIPIKISNSDSVLMAIKWIIKNAKERTDKENMQSGLYLELLDVYLMRGRTFKKKQNMEKIINSNRAFIK